MTKYSPEFVAAVVTLLAKVDSQIEALPDEEQAKVSPRLALLMVMDTLVSPPDEEAVCS